MSVGISAFAHDRKTGSRVTLGHKSLHTWTGSISKLLSGSGKGQHKTMVPETEKIRNPRSPSGDSFLTVKRGGRAQTEHDAPVGLGRQGPGFGTAEATGIREAGGHRGGSCAEGVPRTLCGRRNGLHMHRAGLRKACQEVLLQG